MKRYMSIAPAVALMLVMSMCNPSQAASVTATWTYDYNANPPCSATVTVSCVSGFQFLDVTTSTHVILATVANPTPASGATTVSTTVSNASLGARSFSVAATYIDGSGNAQVGPMATPVTVTITPNAPTNLTVVVAP